MVSQDTANNTQKFEGFDFLRAVFAIAIVADHSGIFSIATIQGMTFATDILYTNFSSVAVPVFFQISLFLFYVKGEKLELNSFFQKRIFKLIYLYLFWVSSFTYFKIFIKNRLNEIVEFKSLSIKSLLEFIVSGGNSQFYFFFSLIFITILAALLITFLKTIESPLKKIKISYWLFFTSCLLIFCFSIIDTIINLTNAQYIYFIQTISNIARWNYNPLNFLPYLFTTVITVQELNQGGLQLGSSGFKNKLYSLFFLFVVFTVLEYFLLKNLMHYSRLSLVFGSWLLLYLSVITKRKSPSSIRMISSLSLGIYTTHVFLTHYFSIDNSNLFVAIFDISSRLGLIFRFLIILSFSVVITYLFKKSKFLNKFV